MTPAMRPPAATPPAASCQRRPCTPALTLSRPCPPAPPQARALACTPAPQGFASGDCDRDSAAIRTFVNDGHRLVRGRPRRQTPHRAPEPCIGAAPGSRDGGNGGAALPGRSQRRLAPLRAPVQRRADDARGTNVATRTRAHLTQAGAHCTARRLDTPRTPLPSSTPPPPPQPQPTP
jgi:hypothetical protein